jgi:hypothetical protein
MASLDGWSLNKKLEELKEELNKKYMLLGVKLMQLEERIDALDVKPKKKSKTKTGSDTTGVS